MQADKIDKINSRLPRARLVQLTSICDTNGFLCLVFTWVERNFYRRRQQGPEDIETHQIENKIFSCLPTTVRGRVIHTDYTYTYTQLVLALKAHRLSWSRAASDLLLRFVTKVNVR